MRTGACSKRSVRDNGMVTLTAPLRLLLVHAHPDDETLWTGGTIARYAARGVQVTLVTCTLGEQGAIIPENLAMLRSDAADQLGGYRVGELRSACAVLGVADHRFLGGIGRWRDSGMAGRPANADPRAFIKGDLDEQVAALAEVIGEVRPQVVVSYAEDGGYGHPDHIRAHQVAVGAARGSGDVARVFYTVQSAGATKAGVARLAELSGMPFRVPANGELPAVPDDTITTVVDIDAYLPAKVRAMRAHGTQISLWDTEDSTPGCYALSSGVAQPLGNAEHFVLARGTAAGATTDLFGGLGLTGTDGTTDEDASW